MASGETGLLEKEIGSVAGLAGRLRWMQDYPGERQLMGKAGRQRVINLFSAALMAKRYAGLYQKLTDR